MLGWLSTILGPIYGKEMVEMSRRKRYYFNRVLYGSALFAASLIVWDDFYWRLYRSGASKIDVLSDMAEAMFLAVSVVQYCAVFLFVPVFVCGVIAAEREDRSLELLFTTDLRNREIVFGKLASRLTVVLLLVLCALPIFSMISLFGGIPPAALWRTQAATLLAMIYAGAHAIYFSSVSKGTIGALVRTYWWIALWMLAVPAMLILIVDILSSGRIRALEWILFAMVFFNPLFQIVTALDPFSYNQWMSGLSRFGPLGQWFFPASFVIPLSWSALLLWRAVARLRHEPHKLAVFFRRVPVFGPFIRWTGRLREGLDARRRRRADRVFRRFEVRNPLWLRARVASVYDRDGHVRRIQLGGWALVIFFFVMILIADPQELTRGDAAIGFLACIWIGVALLTVIVSATSLASDRRRGFLELALATPMPARTFLHGTVLAVWEHLRLIYILPWVVGLFFCMIGGLRWAGTDFRWLAAASTLVTATLFGATIVAAGVMCSLVSRSIPHALVMTIIYALVMNVGTPCLVGMFEKASGPVLWVLSAVFCLATWRWCKRRLTATSVGCRFLAMHLVFCCIATCWNIGVRHDEFPICTMHPGFLSIAPLENLGRWYRSGRSWYRGVGEWYVAIACYWTALAATLWWANRWTIRNFDRLAGRVMQKEPIGRTGSN